MKLDVLARLVEQLEVDDFCARYPSAALIFGQSTAAADSNYDTVPIGDPGPTPVRAPREVQFLEKSPRNPFKNMITVGRSTNNDLCLNDATIPKAHAAFVKDGESWSLLDPGSTNGTKVDGTPLEKGKAVPLHENSRIEFGRNLVASFYTARGLFDFLKLELIDDIEDEVA